MELNYMYIHIRTAVEGDGKTHCPEAAHNASRLKTEGTKSHIHLKSVVYICFVL